jgi:WD40 repeat protein
MHIAKIKASIDSLDRYLVTGSDNKTIKIWELKSGRLIKR